MGLEFRAWCGTSDIRRSQYFFLAWGLMGGWRVIFVRSWLCLVPSHQCLQASFKAVLKLSPWEHDEGPSSTYQARYDSWICSKFLGSGQGLTSSRIRSIQLMHLKRSGSVSIEHPQIALETGYVVFSVASFVYKNNR